MPESRPEGTGANNGATIAVFAEAVQTNNLAQVRTMLAARPELIALDRAGNDEHRALHYAVLQRNLPMVQLLMEAGADARKGIFPHRDATTALVIARDRGYQDVVAIIEAEERHRREEMSCPNATVSPIQDQITSAIHNDDSATAIHLLEADPSLIQACDRDGANPLHIAAEENNLPLVEWLLHRRGNTRKLDAQNRTPLDRAALAAGSGDMTKDRFPAIAAALLAHGSELTIRGAVALGEHERVRQLIASDPKLLRQVNSRGGLLTLAVNHGKSSMVSLLLDLGADVNERTLLEELEEPTETWGMPLWHAALAGNLEISRILLDRGADPNANVYASGWPLRNAWNLEDKSVRDPLLARGARPQPYMLAEMHDLEGARQVLSMNPTEEIVSELVWSAADHGCPEIVSLALRHTALPLHDPRWHWVLIQPIRGAGSDTQANQGHFESMKILLQHGIDPNVSRFGQTALHFAAARQSELNEADRARFASLLLDSHARFDLRDDLLRSTALGWACRWGRKQMVEVLLQRGAPAHEPDAEPWATPLAWARKMGRVRLVSLLEGLGTL